MQVIKIQLIQQHLVVVNNPFQGLKQDAPPGVATRRYGLVVVNNPFQGLKRT